MVGDRFCQLCSSGLPRYTHNHCNCIITLLGNQKDDEQRHDADCVDPFVQAARSFGRFLRSVGGA